jgi:hypothetical protein
MAIANPWQGWVALPWQWLTCGQNAAALQGICAVLAFYLLWRYTVYTKRMMELGEIARRSAIVPVFSAKEIAPHYLNPNGEPDAVCRVSMTVRNIGQGPAAVFWAWHQPVSERFAPSKSEILIASSSARPGFVPEGDLMSGDAMEIFFDAFDPNNPIQNDRRNGLMYAFPIDRKWLFVIDAIDQAGGKHQLQMIRNAGEEAPIDIKMVHSLGETFGERLTKKVGRAVEILLAAKVEIGKLFK